MFLRHFLKIVTPLHSSFQLPIARNNSLNPNIGNSGNVSWSEPFESILLRLPRVSVCLCAKFDQFLPVHSHFDTKRPVNVFHIATFQSATFGRPLFAFVLCVLRQKIIKKPKMLGKRIDRRNR